MISTGPFKNSKFKSNLKSFVELKVNDSKDSIFILHISEANYVLFDKNNNKIELYKQWELSSVLNTVNNAKSITFNLLKLSKNDKFSIHRGKKRANIK